LGPIPNPQSPIPKDLIIVKQSINIIVNFHIFFRL
jgi:hypothetical protein